MTVMQMESGTTKDDVVYEFRGVPGNSGDPIYQRIDSVDPKDSFGVQASPTCPFSLSSDAVDPIARIVQAIQDSRSLLRLPDNCAEGGSGPCSIATWLRATTFLKNHAKWSLQRDGLVVPVPAILPGPGGSIDLHWKTGGYELLVNIPSNPGARASFYADDFKTLSIKGTFDTACPNRGLISWLTDRVAEALTEPAAIHGEERQAAL
jgi:hypothetical protein